MVHPGAARPGSSLTLQQQHSKIFCLFKYKLLNAHLKKEEDEEIKKIFSH
jgi:hypothetical protein